MKGLDLGKEKISKLLLAFAIPTVISMLVNSVYNIVDQIFIGQGVGTLGNAATNVIFPLVILFSAIAGLIGNGASANLSLKLGEGKKEEAAKVVGSAISLVTIVSIVIYVIAFILLSVLVRAFGATDTVYPYAMDYGRIIIIGAPFMIIYSALSSLIRADGSPKYSMALLVVGAIINIILDPIFIFGFKLGVQGGSLATIIGQIISCIMAVVYFRKTKSIKLKKESFKIDKTVLRSVTLGTSSFITQMTVLVLFVFMNNILTKLGASSKFGADIPLSAYGVISKISNLFISTVLGISIGSQPIIGFNYGAGNYKRVKDTMKLVIKINLIVGIIFNIIFYLFPRQLAGLFITPSDPSYELFMEFATLLCRVFLMVLAINALEISTSTLAQSLGNVKKATILAFLRQIILFIPISLLISLGLNKGVQGVLFAGPIADIITFIVAIFMLKGEFTRLSKPKDNEVEEEFTKVTSKNSILNNKKLVITIAREYGSGGRYVGKLLAENLGINIYDKELIILASKESGLAKEYIKEKDEKSTSKSYEMNNDDRLFIAEKKVIEDLANKESCVIVGRCANYILKDKKDVINIFLYSDSKSKEERAVKYYGLDKSKASKLIEKENKLRSKHYKYYTGENWYNFDNYDLTLNVDKLGVEKTAKVIEQYIMLNNEDK